MASKGKTPILKVKAQIRSTKADVRSLNSQIRSLASQLDPIKLKVTFDDKASKNAAANLEKIMKSLQSEMSSFNKNFGVFGSGAQEMSVLAQGAKQATDAIEALTTATTNLSKEKGTKKSKDKMLALQKSVKDAEGKVAGLSKRFLAFEDKNPKFLEKYGTQVDELRNGINELYMRFEDNPDPAHNWDTKSVQKANAKYAELNAQLRKLQDQAVKSGLAGDTLGGRIKAAIEKFGGWTLVTRSVMGVRNQIKKMIDHVKELDLAMTELKKVTNETDAEYERFLTRATKRAKELGATLVDTVNSTAVFSRLGYGISQAEELSNAAIVMKNVADGIDDIEESSNMIVSTMKAFNIQASDAMTITNKFNEINLPVSLCSNTHVKDGFYRENPRDGQFRGQDCVVYN